MADLKSCPFCGAAARKGMTDDRKEQPFVYIVGCSRCPISMDWQATEAQAITAWNTRPEAPATQAVEAMRERAAKVAETMYVKDAFRFEFGHNLAAAIRALPLGEKNDG